MGVLRRITAALRGRPRANGPAQPARPVVGVPEMLGAVGSAMLASSRATSAVELILAALSAAYGRSDVRSFVLPTLVLVEDPQPGSTRTVIFPVGGTQLRLDQAGDTERLVERAEKTRMPPPEVVRELDRIRFSAPRFGVWARMLGHVVLTVGFGLVLDPVAAALPVYAILGALVGAIVVWSSRVPRLSLVLPVFTAFAITLLTCELIVPLVQDNPIRLVAPALVSFLPGLTLTLAAVELTSNQVVAGASRMVYGAAQLSLLAFGVFAAISVAGRQLPTGAPAQLGAWAPWLGIALTAIGYTLFSVAPRGAWPWIVVTLAIAYGGQLLGSLAVGPQLSGFVGAVIVIVAVNLLRLIPGAPPSAVMLTCAYWLLVPGGLGFIGLGEAAEHVDGATASVTQTAVSLLAIAIGMVVGAAASREVRALTRGWRRRVPNAS